MNASDYKKTLAMAVNNEVEAYEFYKSAAKKSVNVNLKSIFTELADEELKHKKLLEMFLNDQVKVMKFNETPDYKISETVELPKLTAAMSFVDGIALAMKKEEEAMVSYNKFAAASVDQEQKDTFLQLAKMEQGHKAKLEALYTDTAYAEVW